MSKRIMKVINKKPIRMWIDGKCYNLKQYNQDKYKKLLEDSKNKKIERIIPIKCDTKSSVDAKVSSEEIIVINSANEQNSLLVQYNRLTELNVSSPLSAVHDKEINIPVQFESGASSTSTQNVLELDCEDKTKDLSTSTEVPVKITHNEKLFDVRPHESGKFISRFQIPKFYYEKLKNFYGLDYLATISKETNTDISVPGRGKPGKLSIFGENEESVVDAITEIHSVIGKIRDQNMALQFIGIPCLSNEVKEKFQTFKAEILNGDKINGMHESIFQSPQKLHITVNVLVLLDDREKTEAIQALQDYKSTVLEKLLEKTGPMKIHVYGIDCMQGNLQKVDVLYAKVKIVNETNEFSLQKMVNDLSNYFYDRGLLRRYEENIKLHMTLINTKYRSVSNSPKRSRWGKRQSFDARSIMEKYKNYDFGFCDLDSIHLSLISSRGEDGFYVPLSVIRLNEV